jgi:mannose-6-phosphate isomerase
VSEWDEKMTIQNETMGKIVSKPWGREIWLELNNKYCYKRIYINQGHKTSFQYHEKKLETNYIISGNAEIWLENDDGHINIIRGKTGDYFTVLPHRKHRVIALTDIVLQEVSTPEVDDVFRIEDDTNRVHGRISSEHLR